MTVSSIATPSGATGFGGHSVAANGRDTSGYPLTAWESLVSALFATVYHHSYTHPDDMDGYTHPAYTVCTNIAIAEIFILGIIVVVGIICNCLTFVVFRKGNFNSATSCLFLSLSLIDMAVLLTLFTCSIATLDVYIDWLPMDVSVYLGVCVWPLRLIAETATVWMTVLITVNRYIIVCRPLRASQWCTHSRVNIQLAVMLVLVVLYNIPQIVRYRVVHITRNNGTSYEAYWYVEHAMGDTFPKFYYVYDIIMNPIVLVWLPLLIISLLTVRLIKAMEAHRRMQAQMQRQHSQPDNSMTFALVIVVVVFIICRAPFLIIVKVVSFLIGFSFVVTCYINVIYYTLIALNPVVNFLIYIFINRQFRNVLFANICKRRSAIPMVTPNVMAMPERETAIRERVDDTDTRL